MLFYNNYTNSYFKL